MTAVMAGGAASVLAVWLTGQESNVIAITALLSICALGAVVLDQQARVSGGWRAIAMMQQAGTQQSDRQRADIRAAEAERRRDREEIAVLHGRLDQVRAEQDARQVEQDAREREITERVAEILVIGARLANGSLEVRESAAGDRFERAVLGSSASVIEMRRPPRPPSQSADG